MHLSAHLPGMLCQGWRPGAFPPSTLRSTVGCWQLEPAARSVRQAVESSRRDALALCSGPNPSLCDPAANASDDQSVNFNAAFYSFPGNLFERNTGDLIKLILLIG